MSQDPVAVDELHYDIDSSESGQENRCREPCDPDVGCEHCADYWQRMEHEGFWDRRRRRWTPKGWREITK